MPPRQPTSSRSSRSRWLARPRGFALIISLTLAAFLVLLLLSLTFMVRTAAEVANSGLPEIQARQNALVGLQTAIGQLEKFDGHDQRITFTAEFADSSILANGQNISLPGPGGGKNIYAQTVTNSYVKNGQNAVTAGLPVNLQTGTRFWTAVAGPLDPANDSYVRSPKPVLLTWLVSGNEQVNFVASTFSGGQIITASHSDQMPFTPDTPVQGVTTQSTALSTVTIGGTQGILLVGPGTASWSSASTLPGLPDAYVVAPLVPISMSSTLLPGGGSGNKLSGRFGYAVLDEGVKAKVNLRDPYDGYNVMNVISTTSIPARVRMQVAQRNGIELVPGFSDTFSANSVSYPVNTSSVSTSTFTSAKISNVVSLKELRFVDPTATTSTTDTSIKSNFHNLTAYSFGVLSDTRAGGLKIDLTSLLDDGPTSKTYNANIPFSPNAFYNERLRGISILPSSRMVSVLPRGDARYTWIDPARKDTSQTSSATDVSPFNAVLSTSPLALPSWDMVKSWYDISKQLDTGTTSSVTAQIGTSMIANLGLDRSGSPGNTPLSSSVPLLAHITPVMTQARIYASVKLFRPVITPNPPPPATATSTIWTMTYAFNIQLAFAVGNPYAAPLYIPKGLEFVWINPNNGYYSQTASTAQSGRSSWSGLGSSSVTFSVAGTTGGGNSSIPLVLQGNFNKTNTVSNSWTSTQSFINGLDPLPTINPSTYSAVSGFTYRTDTNLVIPTGGIVGFQIDPNAPAMSFGDTAKGNVSIHLVTVTSGSPNTLTTSSMSISSSGQQPPVTLSISNVPKTSTTISVSTGIGDGSNFSIYMRDLNNSITTSAHQVYGSIIGPDWANATGTTQSGTPAIVGPAGTTTGGAAGGYLINLMLPSVPVSITNAGASNDTTYSQRLQAIGVPLVPDDGTGSWRHADFNLQAQYRPVPWVSTAWVSMTSPPPYRGLYLNSSGAVGGGTGTLSASGVGIDAMNGSWPPAWGPNFSYNPVSSSVSGSLSYQMVLYDLPRRNGTLDMPILSVGFLTHANLTADDQYPFVGHQTNNAVGNSWFHPLVSRTMAKELRPNIWYANNAPDPFNKSNSGAGFSTESVSATDSTIRGTNYFDMPYLLNTALWDRFYFSAIPQVTQARGGTVQSVNPRLKYGVGVTPTDVQLALGDITATASAPDAFNPALKIPKEYAAARYLMTDGAFNINSTSIEAWIAVLSGLRKRDGSASDTSGNVSNATTGASSGSTSFPRTLNQPRFSAGDRESTQTFSSYAGYRRLTDAQIVALATCLVQEIRLRGPFPTLASFINRGGITGTNSATTPLVMRGMEGDTSQPHGGMVPGYLTTEANTIEVAGPLQMAIDRAGINITNTTSLSHTGSNSVALTVRPNYDINMTTGANGGSGGSVTNSTPYADLLPKTTISASVTTAIPPGTGVTMSRDTGIPGWLTQADILQAIGPNLSARSDTFVIRAYGDAIDLVNFTGDQSSVKPTDIQARAWCEAVVQRFPDYLDPSDPASVHPSGTNSLPLSDGGVPIKLINQVYGRRFRIVSFRWLSKEEI